MVRKVIHFLRGIGAQAVPVSVPTSLRFASIGHFFTALSLCMAVVHPSAHSQALGELQALGQGYTQTKPATDTNARLTIYRPASDAGPGAVTVFVNARYHASLMPGSFIKFCVKLAPIQVGVRAADASGDERASLIVSKVTPLAGSQQFYSLTQQPLNTTAPSGRKVTLEAKTRKEAEVELLQTREQIHTLSRAPMVVACEDAPPAQSAVVVTPIPSSDSEAVYSTAALTVPATVPVPVESPAPAGPQVITLLADVLFQIDKAGLSNISTPGRSTLDVVIARVKSQYERIDGIKVLGQSDFFGRPELKQIQALERAETVRDYFLANGMQSIRVVSEGRSDKELVIATCDSVKTKASTLCNAPNRRVAIEIMGARSKSP